MAENKPDERVCLLLPQSRLTLLFVQCVGRAVEISFWYFSCSLLIDVFIAGVPRRPSAQEVRIEQPSRAPYTPPAPQLLPAASRTRLGAVNLSPQLSSPAAPVLVDYASPQEIVIDTPPKARSLASLFSLTLCNGRRSWRSWKQSRGGGEVAGLTSLTASPPGNAPRHPDETRWGRISWPSRSPSTMWTLRARRRREDWR